MSNQEIFNEVDKFVIENLQEVPFDKGLPLMQDFVWELGNRVGKTGIEVMKIYFDIKAGNK